VSLGKGPRVSFVGPISHFQNNSTPVVDHVRTSIERQANGEQDVEDVVDLLLDHFEGSLDHCPMPQWQTKGSECYEPDLGEVIMQNACGHVIWT